MHFSNSPVSAPLTIVTNLGHYLNYYNLAHQHRDELEGLFLDKVFPRKLSHHIYFQQLYHSNYPIDRRGPGSRSTQSCCRGNNGPLPLC